MSVKDSNMRARDGAWRAVGSAVRWTGGLTFAVGVVIGAGDCEDMGLFAAKTGVALALVLAGGFLLWLGGAGGQR